MGVGSAGEGGALLDAADVATLACIGWFFLGFHMSPIIAWHFFWFEGEFAPESTSPC